MPVVKIARTRPVIGILLAASGVLVALGVAVQQLPGAVINGNWWWFDFAAVVLGLALVVIAASLGLTAIGVAAFWLAAAGWLVLALGVVLRLGVLSSAGAVMALAGGLVGGVLAVQEHAFARLGDIVLLVAMILGSIYLVDFIAAILPATLQTVERLLFAVSLLVAGILILLKR